MKAKDLQAKEIKDLDPLAENQIESVIVRMDSRLLNELRGAAKEAAKTAGRKISINKLIVHFVVRGLAND